MSRRIITTENLEEDVKIEYRDKYFNTNRITTNKNA